MPDETITTPPPQSFKEAYVDPINAAPPPSEEKPPTAGIDITHLPQCSIQALSEIIIELRTKIARIDNEKIEIAKTIKHYCSLLTESTQKINFYLSLISIIKTHLQTAEPRPTESTE